MIFSIPFQLFYYNITEDLISIPFYCSSHNKRIFGFYRNEITHLQKTAISNELSSKDTTEEVSEMEMENKVDELSCGNSNALNLNFNDLIESDNHHGNYDMDLLAFNDSSFTDINPFDLNYKEMGLEDNLFFSFNV